jgi:hypothetical protein
MPNTTSTPSRTKLSQTMWAPVNFMVSSLSKGLGIRG